MKQSPTTFNNTILSGLALALALAGCGDDFAISGQTVGLVRLVRPGVEVTYEGARMEVMEETRLIGGTKVIADGTGRAIVDLDGGGRVIVDAGTEVVVPAMDRVKLEKGRLWIEAGQDEEIAIVLGGGGTLRASDTAVSVVYRDGKLETYSTAGELTYDLEGGSGVAREGEILSTKGGKVSVEPAELWTDWTGGLAEAGPQPSDTPTGIGEIYARRPGSLGVTRMPLVIRRHDVRVTIEGELAVTETVQEFFNPASDTLEGVYKLRIPEDAVLQRFAVDRDGKLVDGYIKEKKKAAAEYASHVYEGSTQDPALLEWIAPGQFQAKIYPIEAGDVRVVAYRYVQWLEPSGPEGDKRTYVLPMGSQAAPPLIGEFSIIADLEKVGTEIVQAGLGARVEEGKVVFSASDFRPKSDFWLELVEVDHGLKDGAVPMWTHTYEGEEGLLTEQKKQRYFLTQFLVRPEKTDLTANRDLEVAIVSDLSAATDPGLADLGLTFADSFLKQLDSEDSIVVLAGDLETTDLIGGEGEPKPVKATEDVKEKAIDSLSRRSTGGATDIGTLITQAAALVGGKPGGVVVYVGDAFPTVGEMDLQGLLERLSKLPHAVRLYGVALGDEANVDLLAGMCEGSGAAYRVASRMEAADTAYRLLADASVPVLTDVTYEIDGEVERLYPRHAVTLRVNEPLSIMGRIVGKDDPESITITGKLGGKKFEVTHGLEIEKVEDHGDLKLRWAVRRLESLTRQNAGREALVELGTRYQIITPYTSFYVPPADEAMHLPIRPEFEIFIMPEEQQQQKRKGLFGAVGLLLTMGQCGCSRAPGGFFGKDEAEQGASQEQVAQERWVQLEGREESAEEEWDDEEAGAMEADRAMAQTESTAKREEMNAPSAAPGSGEQMYGLKGPGDLRDMAKGGGDGGGGTGIGYGGLGGKPAPSMDKKAAPKSKGGKKKKRKSSASWELEEKAKDSGILGILGGGEVDLDSLYYDASGSTGYGSYSTTISDAEAQAMTWNEAPTTLQGALDPGTVSKVSRTNSFAVRSCYEDQLAMYPELQGRVVVKAVVGSSGKVIDTDVLTSSLDNGAAETCILSQVRSWHFPVAENAGVAVVQVPFNFKQSSDVLVNVDQYDNFGMQGNVLNLQVQQAQQLVVQSTNNYFAVDNMYGILGPKDNPDPHFAKMQARKYACSLESKKPLADRKEIWAERLGPNPTVSWVVTQFNQARRNCEMKGKRDRRAFVRLALARLPGPGEKCQLMNRLSAYPDLQDYVRTKILDEVTSPYDMQIVREVCDGATTAKPEEIEKALDEKKSHEEKIKAVKKLIKIYPTDMSIKLVLLDLLEDAPGGKRIGEAKRLAEDLRHHPYADDRVRTRVGEFYMRIEKPGEAKRTFSEIVEFRPYSPEARKRLGDLYRTYGWYEDSYRQYETLSLMVPSDESILILMAESAALAGRVDEAVRLAERVSQSAAAGSGTITPADIARLFNGIRLAEMRIEARSGGDEDEIKDLMKRSRRAGVLRDVDGLKVILKWDHPDVVLDLLVKDAGSEIRGADMTADTWGAEWFLRKSDRMGDIEIQVVRGETSIRKETRATLWIVFDEGEDGERIEKIEVTITDEKKDTLAWLVSPAGEVKETTPSKEEPIGAKTPVKKGGK